MSKVLLTPEEFQAMENFNECQFNFESKISQYLTWHNTWQDTYLPLKDMGLEKFVKCLLNGYIIEEPEFKLEKMMVALNVDLVTLQKNPDIVDPIFIRLDNNNYSGLSINEAEFLIDSLQKTVKFLKENNIGGR